VGLKPKLYGKPLLLGQYLYSFSAYSTGIIILNTPPQYCTFSLAFTVLFASTYVQVE
jgi:hypothetical protein